MEDTCLIHHEDTDNSFPACRWNWQLPAVKIQHRTAVELHLKGWIYTEIADHVKMKRDAVLVVIGRARAHHFTDADHMERLRNLRLRRQGSDKVLQPIYQARGQRGAA